MTNVGAVAEIITQLVATKSSPRPPFPHGKLSPEIENLMQQCWHADPSQRPSFQEIVTVLNEKAGIRKGFSYVDTIILRLEKYATDLELQVGERTQCLLQEKHRTEELLSEILPESIARDLVKGNHIAAEIFDSATIAFTEIWGFALLVSIQSPLQIVGLLNDLYVCIDDLLPRYDVYKMETIKDSYMIASGVPKRNGKEHVTQVALVCCTINKTVKHETFGGISVNLREGFHSGPVAAGVVGQRMPRYCLFGDTVNIASRMMTTSEPQKIQITPTSRDLLADSHFFKIASRGEVEVKGKGTMSTFWLESKIGLPKLPVGPVRSLP